MLGMKTGYPLYVVGSSTFGTTGGYLMPGLLMGLLQIGWFAVGTFYSTTYILKGFGKDATPGTLSFGIVAVLWGYIMGYIGVKGIQYVAKVSLFLNLIPALMILVVFFKTAGGIANYVPDPAKSDPWCALMLIIAAVVGFFATAGAAGADFGMNSRDERDVRMGGLVGICPGDPSLLAACRCIRSRERTGSGSALTFNFDAVIGQDRRIPGHRDVLPVRAGVRSSPPVFAPSSPATASPR